MVEKVKKSNSSQKKRDRNVPEQLRGFTAQETRMAMLLWNAPGGSWVSMEKLDDVGQEDADGSSLHSQSKDYSSSNPVANRSLALWKTLSNWTYDVRIKNIDPTSTTFEMYVSRKVSGPIVSSFHDAKNKAACRKALKAARELLWGKHPNYPKRAKVAASIAPFLDEVFGAGEKAFLRVMERFQLTCSNVNPEDDLLEAVRNGMRLEDSEIVDEILVDVLGWLKRLSDSELRARRAPCISRDEFYKKLKHSYERMRPNQALPDFGKVSPSSSDLAKMLCERFVQQLSLIELPDRSLYYSMACLFKARTARTKWSELGYALATEDEVRWFEDTLMHAWENNKTQVFSDPLRTDEKIKGRILLKKCEEHRCSVSGKDAPDYFIPGCFHELANEGVIGWHPRFEALLRNMAA